MRKSLSHAPPFLNWSLLKISIAPRFQVVLFIALLALQNLVVFQNQYFHDFGFPWDFTEGYYAMTVIWTTLVSQGVYPAWVPFHSMGMPFALILQTGAHYPPLWIFPLFKIEYSLHAAVVFQSLHVLFGAVGMFLFLRLSIPSNRYQPFYAFFGAFVFQFFGGFYSNAEHVDIIRAFALAPWLFYFFYLCGPDSPKLSLRHFYIPGLILFISTGAYPGNIISGLSVAGLFCLLQLIWIWQQGSTLKDTLRLAALIFLMTCLGLGLSFFHVAPAWLLKDYLLRGAEAGHFNNMVWLTIKHLPALFLENGVVPGETSMSSTYLTLPALIVLSFLPLRVIKRQWVSVGILTFSVSMAAGPNSFFWSVLTKVLTPMQYSRFPSSDYRIFAAIMLVYLACLAIKAVAEGDITRKALIARIVLVLFWFFLGIDASYPALRMAAVYQASAICISTLACLTLFICFGKQRPRALLSLMLAGLLLTSLDAIRVLPRMGLFFRGVDVSTWQLPSISTLYERQGWPLRKNGHLLTYEILPNAPHRRPARIQIDDVSDYRGFTTGAYTLNTVRFSNMLKSAAMILDQPIYKEFMLSEWVPLFFEEPQHRPGDANIAIPIDSIGTAFRKASNDNSEMVRQVFYGVNMIEYTLSLAKPMLMVENEIYFPGWSATLKSEQRSSQIQAISVNDIFRAWQLPAGNYEMTARFELPNLWVYNGISIASLTLWVLIFFGRNRSRNIRSCMA